MEQKMQSVFEIESPKGVFNLGRGFLPKGDPLQFLPEEFAAWEGLARDLPKLLTSSYARSQIEDLPPFPVNRLDNPGLYERAMLILSYLGHAYIWNNADPVDRLPAIIAQPWYQVASHLGRPPVLSYASYALYNWRRVNQSLPIELGNIVLLQNFLGGIDEEWFILIHVDIEAKAARGLAALNVAINAVNGDDVGKVMEAIDIVISSLESMCEILERMPEHCDPYIYFNRVRPYIHGWKDNPALPEGVVYEGVAAYHNKPQFFKGETGAQSSIIPSLDAALGIVHRDSPLKVHLDEMHIYMPQPHQAWLRYLDSKPSLREFMKRYKGAQPTLIEKYNQCIQLVHRFRQIHIGYAAQYIQKQHQLNAANSTAVGTGGTPFMKYLNEHVEETIAHLM